MKLNWTGVFPAVTTKFNEDLSIDFKSFESSVEFQINAGVHGIVTTGSLGESSTLSASEKLEVLQSAIRASAGRVPVVAGIAENSTDSAARLAEGAAKNGASGLMLLPGMLYPSDPRETMQHFRTVARATDLPIMIYNNPVAYKVDTTPEMFAMLADEPAFEAIKESSDNTRRITDIINLTGDRYRVFTGVDNLALESLLLGAVGWVAGLVCAFPRETVVLYELAKAGRLDEAVELYRWFMPLLHLDVSTKLVQNIKLAETMAGVGSETVRPPRLPLIGEERDQVVAIIETALSTRPKLPSLEIA